MIVAGITSVALVGNYTYFGSTHAALTEPRMWLVVPVCGVVGGIAGGAFSRCMLALRRPLPGFLGHLKNHAPVRFALFCGMVVAVIGWGVSSVHAGGRSVGR